MGVLEQPAAPATAPYRRIAAELRARIASGEIGPGEKVPSVRRIAQEWGVATATAAKVLSVLREEGVVRAVPGVGTVVAAPCGGAGPGEGDCAERNGRPPRAAGAGAGPSALRKLTPERIVRTAIALADAHGAAALSMRALAAELGVPTMALYRHVPGKDDLVARMADAAFGECSPPAGAPGDWRGRLLAAARYQWAVYRRHPWLARAMVSVPRPRLPACATGLMERAMAPAPASRPGPALEAGAVVRIGVTVAGYVRGVAVNLEDGAAARRARGGTDADLDAMFEFGLARLLDGLSVYVEQRRGCS
ncbi:GntR family transcriptional regulator [Streptomyces rectiverticillatus]|uniref:GntR family transcriptional regulator n=1 Tax=Streptomyces rectiverticillatus TaxID=173860 RepID=UPI0015C3B2BE|nr:GntR family transcriptional regulator [Streptomyces rectiverticillatus]QLE74116.1 GntR family transcriptional regulator [Streptomyces rectiverticillatus]